MTTDLVLDTLEHAIWTRQQAGVTDLSGLIHHTDAGSQYVSFAFTQRLVDEGVDPSVGSVGDAYDNALAESQIGLYKAELIRPEGPWRGVEHVELETLNWVDFFNNERPHEALDDLTPMAAEELTTLQETGSSRPAEPSNPAPGLAGAVQRGLADHHCCRGPRPTPPRRDEPAGPHQPRHVITSLTDDPEETSDAS